MKTTLLCIALLAGLICFGQNSHNPLTNYVDIGNPKLKGSTTFNAGDQSYSLKGGGANIWNNRDEFHYAYTMLKGDFMLTANVKLMGVGKEPHRKIGWMVRASQQDDAANMSATLHADGLTTLHWRPTRGAYMRAPQNEIRILKKNPQIIQLERVGKTFIMRIANTGEPLQEVGRTDMIEMPDSAMAGIFLCSHNADQVEEAQVWNVRIEKTVPDNYNGYRDGTLGNRMETMNVFDGKRMIIHENVTTRFEAPNWMPDGKRLLFNQGGSIYTIPIEGGTPEKLNTGNVNRNNNDHVISFDGKSLALSSQRAGMLGGGSTIYYLPITGGDPKIVTDSTPSYLHGWSPNGKEVVYTAQRISKSPVYQIHKKAVAGGPEIQLTFNTYGRADGPEYSPDGKWIYFNADYSGTMQIWRMKPDGTSMEQLTFDEYNDWFPHISPDGKWMVFLSYPYNIDPPDHPFYKKCLLRMMPVSGGPVKVIAYLYGGQGTINTPSWSPDSKRIAFVSNSKALDK
jgi:TolB protein